jgi:RimK family alpha-L-glutamate ligase
VQEITEMQAIEIASDHPRSIPGSTMVSAGAKYHDLVTILVLSSRPETASNRRLAAVAANTDVSLLVADSLDLAATSSGDVFSGGKVPGVRDPDVVLARVGNWRADSVLALLETLTARGAATPNPPAAIRAGRDHWRTALMLAEIGLPTPDTVAGADPELLASAAADRLRFPVVVKQRRSRMGVGVIRCAAMDHLEAVLDSLWRVGDEIVVQQWYETGGASLRLFVVGGDVVAAAKFTAARGEWRSNAARGGSVASWQGESAAVDLAVSAARAIGLGICGVDLLPTHTGYLVCEINPTPGFVHLEKATGADVAGAVVRYLAELGD